MVVVDRWGVESAAEMLHAMTAMAVSPDRCTVARLMRSAIFGATQFAVADAEKPTLVNGPALLRTVSNRAAVQHLLAVRLGRVHSVDLDRA